MQRDAVDAPLVLIERAAVESLLGALWRDVWLAGLQRVPEEPHDLVGIGLAREDMDNLVEITPDQIRNVPEQLPGDWIDLANAKVRIDEINAKRRRIEQRLELRGTCPQGGLHCAALEERAHPREQFSGREGLDQIVIGTGIEPFDAGLLARTRGEQDHGQTAQRVVFA